MIAPPDAAPRRAPEYVRAIAPYVRGKPIEEVARELGLDPATIVKLASNENPRGPSPKALAAIAAAAADVTRYPDGNGFALKAALARGSACGRSRSCSATAATTCSSSSRRRSCDPGDRRRLFAARVHRVSARDAGARRARHRGARARSSATISTRCAPRSRRARASCSSPIRTIRPAPGSRATLSKRSSRACRATCSSCSTRPTTSTSSRRSRSHATRWIARYPNLVVSRTFSKAYGLAALRVGYGVMDAAVADLLNRVRQPFNVNALAQAAALAALDDAEYVEESRRLNRDGMRSSKRACSALSRAQRCRRTATSCSSKVGDAARDLPVAAAPGRDRAAGRELRPARMAARHRRPAARRTSASSPRSQRRKRASIGSAPCASTSSSSSASA